VKDRLRGLADDEVLGPRPTTAAQEATASRGSGREWGHSSIRYIVEVPVTAHFRRANGQWATLHAPGGRHALDHPREQRRHRVLRRGEAGDLQDAAAGGPPRRARDVGSHNRQKQFIREAIVRYLQAQPRDDDGSIVLSAYDQSDAYYTLDEGALADPGQLRLSSDRQSSGDARRRTWRRS
jgi:hypothetical protein